MPMMKREMMGGLECRVIGGPPDAGAKPDLAVVLCHGYGAPGDDLVPIGSEIAQDDPVLATLVRFVFPAAPLVMGGLGPWESRAWWRLDDRVLDAAVSAGRPLDIRREAPPELPERRQQIMRLVEELGTREGLPCSRIVLGGFSQGAMLATEAALRLPEPPAALGVFSGALLDETAWKALAPARRGLPVLMSHGRQDPLLSLASAEALRDLFVESGLDVDFRPFDGQHTIPADAVRGFLKLLRRLVGTAS